MAAVAKPRLGRSNGSARSCGQMSLTVGPGPWASLPVFPGCAQIDDAGDDKRSRIVTAPKKSAPRPDAPPDRLLVQGRGSVEREEPIAQPTRQPDCVLRLGRRYASQRPSTSAARSSYRKNVKKGDLQRKTLVRRARVTSAKKPQNDVRTRVVCTRKHSRHAAARAAHRARTARFAVTQSNQSPHPPPVTARRGSTSSGGGRLQAGWATTRSRDSSRPAQDNRRSDPDAGALVIEGVGKDATHRCSASTGSLANLLATTDIDRDGRVADTGPLFDGDRLSVKSHRRACGQALEMGAVVTQMSSSACAGRRRVLATQATSSVAVW